MKQSIYSGPRAQYRPHLFLRSTRIPRAECRRLITPAAWLLPMHNHVSMSSEISNKLLGIPGLHIYLATTW